MAQNLLFLFSFSLCLFFQTNGLSQQTTLTWAKTLGGTGTEHGTSIAVDVIGNVYTTGNFTGTVDFDPGMGIFNLTSAGNYSSDIFISKLDASGNFIWAKRFGGATTDGVSSIAVDLTGNVYTTGSFSGIADFDPGPQTYNLTSAGLNSEDIFISKLDSSGSFIWAKKISGLSGERGSSIALDALGNVYTTGHFFDTVDFDPGTMTYNLTAIGDADIFISKLDSAGNFVWAKNIGSTTTDPGNSNADYGYCITLDALGNIYTTGIFLGTVDFDPGPGIYSLTSAGSGSRNMFVLKLDTYGNLAWAKNIGSSNSSVYGRSIKVSASGNVYTTGNFIGMPDFDPGPAMYSLFSGSALNIFISKLDSSGNFLWAKNIGGSTISNYNSGNSISLDVSENVYTTGSFASTVDFDPGTATYNISSAGSSDIFISKLDLAGNFVWAKSIGGTLIDIGASIAIDAFKNVYITGGFEGTPDFDPEAGIYYLPAKGVNDVFVVKLAQPSLLPVNLVSFSAKTINGAQIQLQWQTASEQNTAQFIVERSTNQSSFSPIGAVTAAGNSASAKKYFFIDTKPLQGVNYYRLKIADKDGSFTYSKIEAVNMNAIPKGLHIYPNPVKDVLQVQSLGQNGTVNLQITDGSGKKVKQQKIQLNGSNIFSIDVHGIPAGKYYLILQQKNSKKILEFVKIMQ